MIFFTGFLVGLVSLIPGISGGTILVISKKYDIITSAISNPTKKENVFLIISLVIGILLGTITFARIIEFLFYFFPNETMILFGGFVLFHLPKLIRNEKEKPKFNWVLFGIFLIWLISLFSSSTDVVITNYPEINILFLIYFTLCGAIDGFFTIIPGISGSMIMMILGPYFLYKSYLANLNLTNIIFLLPLSYYFIGDIMGFFLGSKFSIYFINKYRNIFFSIIYGMVIMSIIIVLPIPTFSFQGITSYLFILLLSYFLYKVINSIK